MRTLLAKGPLPECWIPPAPILEHRALLETYHDLRREHTSRAQLRGLFHQGARRLGEGVLRTEASLAALRAVAATHLSPTGQLQVDAGVLKRWSARTALEVSKLRFPHPWGPLLSRGAVV
jgi:transposase